MSDVERGDVMVGKFKALVALSGLAAAALTPAQSFAQYRDPDDALAGAVVGGAVGGVLGGVLGGWQERQAHHEERMRRERWRQAHGDAPYPGDREAEGFPDRRPAPRAGGARPPGFYGREGFPDDGRGYPPRGRPAEFDGGRGPEFGRRAAGSDRPPRPAYEGRRPDPRGFEPDEDWR